MELRCSRDLALWLGAIEPTNLDHHKELKLAGHMLIRDGTGAALFWPWTSDRIAQLWRHK